MKTKFFKKSIGAALVAVFLLAQMVSAQTWRVGENEDVVMRRNNWSGGGRSGLINEGRFGFSSAYADGDDILNRPTIRIVTRRNNTNRRYDSVVDVLMIGVVNSREGFLVDGCFMENDSDYIVAIVADYIDNDEFYEEFFEKIVRAWRFNSRTEKFESITNFTGIRCPNEGYGL